MERKNAATGGTRNQVTFMLPPELRIELEAWREEINSTKAWGGLTFAEHCRNVLADGAKRWRESKQPAVRIVAPKAAPAKARARR